MAQALLQARNPDIAANFNDEEAGRIAMRCGTLVGSGNALAAVYGYQLILAALELHELSPWQKKLLFQARVSAIMAAKTALMDTPDGALYSWALALVNKGLLDSADAEVIGEMSYDAGVLNLDPYVAGRRLTTRDAYDESIRLWQLRLEQRVGDRFDGVADAARMLEPEDALAAADAWLRKAIHHQSGRDRGRGIKALLQTMLARKNLFDVAVDAGDQIDGLVTDALRLLDIDHEKIEYIAILKMAMQLARPVPATDVEAILKPSVADVLSALPPGRAGDFVTEVVGLLRVANSRRALDIFVEARPLLAAGDQQNRRDLLLLEGSAMGAAVPAAIAAHLQAGVDTAADRAWLDTQATSDETAMACAYVQLAQLSLSRSQEPEGRACIARLRERAPQFADRHREALDTLDITLADGWAVDAVDAQAYGDAVLRYGDAVTLAMSVGLVEQAFSELAYLEQIVMRYRTLEVFDAASHALDTAGFLVQAAGGDRGVWSVVTLAQAVLKMLLEHDDPDAEIISRLLQTVKGAQFAGALEAGVRYAAAADPLARDQLQRIGSVAAESGGDLLGNASVDVDEDVLLNAYFGRFDQSAGATALERLANLQHRFDAYVGDELLPLPRAQAATQTLEDLRTTIDVGTVLLDLYIDADASGVRTAVALVSTNEQTQVLRNPQPGAGSIDVAVGALRRSVVRYTPVGVVDDDAQQQLADDASALLGAPVLEALAAHHAAGRRHLRIVPHGALQFYPMHLLCPADAPLADNWTVTYLPNLGLARPLSPPADAPPVAIGLGFAADPPLPPLTSSIAETTAVAKCFGTPPVLDKDATKSRVLDSFRRARYVHLSTHGKHNVVAPAFQCIYVAGEKTPDRIFAYELLALDLRGLEVLTLSACETALGRFDRGNNVRGLPAALLLAGVHAIVGTLWPVFGDATATFFAAFYAALRPGVRVRDAYRAAQLACQTAYPMYKHWGAFYLIDRTA